MQQQADRVVFVLGNAGFRQAVLVILAHLDEGMGDDVGLDAARCRVGMLVGNLGEIAEGLGLVLRHALAALIHQAELPLRHGVTGGRRVLQRRDLFGRGDSASGAVHGARHRLCRVDRGVGIGHWLGGRHARRRTRNIGRRKRRLLLREDRRRAKQRRQHTYGNEGRGTSRYPHTAPSRPWHPGSSARRNAPAPPVGHTSRSRPNHIRTRAAPSSPCAGQIPLR